MAPRHSSRGHSSIHRSLLNRRTRFWLCCEDDFRAGTQPVMTIDNDPLTCQKPGGDQCLALVCGPDLQSTRLDRAVWSNDIGVASVWPGLHDGVRHDRAMTDFEPQPRIDECTRPRPFVAVGEYGFEPHRPSALVDLIVDQLKVPLAKFLPVVLIEGQHGRRSAPYCVDDLWQILLR